MKNSILSVICLLIGFLVCQYIPGIRFFIKNLEGLNEDNTRMILFRRAMLVFFLGIVPLSLIHFSGVDQSVFGLNFRMPGYIIGSGFAIGLILFLFAYLNHQSNDNLKAFPQIRKKEWDHGLLILSSISWILYLLAYEFFFRGYLLFSMVNDFGKWEAITLNVAFYSLVHVPKGWKEAAGAIPLGFVFCLVCLHTGNFWAAFIAHCCMALSNEWLSLSVHPEIKVIK